MVVHTADYCVEIGEGEVVVEAKLVSVTKTFWGAVFAL